MTKGRPEKAALELQIEKNPRLSRENLIRQSIQSSLEGETDNFQMAVETARTFTDVTYFDNTRNKIKMKKRPEGSHNFEAVKLIKAAYNDEDPYILFDFGDGADGSTPFIMKSGRLKVELLRKLDRDGCHPLSKEVVHLDVVHSRTKGWKTYTLSYYDAQLGTMVRLAVMETPQENWKGCRCFFTVINKMVQKYAEETELLEEGATVVFKPYHIKDNEITRQTI